MIIGGPSALLVFKLRTLFDEHRRTIRKERSAYALNNVQSCMTTMDRWVRNSVFEIGENASHHHIVAVPIMHMVGPSFPIDLHDTARTWCLLYGCVQDHLMHRRLSQAYSGRHHDLRELSATEEPSCRKGGIDAHIAAHGER